MNTLLFQIVKIILLNQRGYWKQMQIVFILIKSCDESSLLSTLLLKKDFKPGPFL